jgi:fido (protein-threonine AMPylation protein)
MNETLLTPRQNFILNLVNEGSGIGRSEIEKRVGNLYRASKPTIARDLVLLVRKKLVRVTGRSIATLYLPLSINPLLKYFDLDQYFLIDPDKRTGAKTVFDFSVFDYLKNLFSKDEITALEEKNKKFGEAIRKLNQDIYLKEPERFVIELSWKSSQIEGNTYSLLETEALVKQSIEAKGHSKEEAAMILNHKRAFESILKAREDFRTLTISTIMQLHNVLTRDLSISVGIREQAVGITGTVYKPLSNKFQIHEALEKLVAAVNKTPFSLEKALIVSSMISYIQPFSDGNKRTRRMLANATLLASDCYPLSYRSVDEVTYKKALTLFYEQGSIYHLKRIFMEQYKFALDTYFQV